MGEFLLPFSTDTCYKYNGCVEQVLYHTSGKGIISSPGHDHAHALGILQLFLRM